MIVVSGISGMFELGRFHLGIALVTVIGALILGITNYRRSKFEAFVSGRSETDWRQPLPQAVQISANNPNSGARQRPLIDQFVKGAGWVMFTVLSFLLLWGGYEAATRIGYRGKHAAGFAIFPWLAVMLGIGSLAARFPRLARWLSKMN